MKRLVDILWLTLLGIFVFAGMPLATFHGDETYHVYTSNDYDILFIQHRPQDLLVHSFWESDFGYQRLMNGGLIRYAIGLSWHLAGMTADDLPKYGYQYGESYEANLAQGLVLPPNVLTIYRIPSTLLTALSVVVIFGIGGLYGGRRLAYVVSALYALNPIVLLNGRRAMQEGALLFFGLLTLYIALRIALMRESDARVRLRWWAALVVAGALAFVSKYNAFIYLIPAYLMMAMPELARRRAALGFVSKLLVSGMLTLVLFFALSPGLWYEPLARIQDVLRGRIEVARTQVDNDPRAPTTLEERAVEILAEPFILPLQHAEIDPVAPQTEIDRYMNSPLSGVQFGAIIGGLLTLLAGVGLLASFVPRLRLVASRVLPFGLHLWLVVNVVVLLANPLPWQRYYLTLIPVVILLAGIGLFSLIKILRPVPVALPNHA